LLVLELAIRDPGDAVAADQEVAVARAVILEGMRRLVGLAAVELDDEPLGGPDGVDGVGADRLVGQRPGERVGVEEGEELDLEVAPGECLAEVAAVDDRLQCSCPPASGVACEEGIEGERAREAAVLRLVDGAFELVRSQDRGEVEQGAGGGGDRDAVLDGVSSAATWLSWTWTPARRRR
jgi:hypothetical protein